jgi:hypothetical protein
MKIDLMCIKLTVERGAKDERLAKVSTAYYLEK